MSMNLSMIGDHHSLRYWDAYITLQNSVQPREGSFKKMSLDLRSVITNICVKEKNLLVRTIWKIFQEKKILTNSKA